MLSVLPYNRTETSERPFKAYNPPSRTTMATFSYAQTTGQGQTTTATAPYYPTYNVQSMATACMPRAQELTSSMYDYTSPQMPFTTTGSTQSWDYSINSMLKKPTADYIPNAGLLPQLPSQKAYAKQFSADSTTITTKSGNVSPLQTSPGSSASSEGQNDKIANDEKDYPPKKRVHSVPDEMKNEHYFDRRKKNNESARRSRDNRRAKEEQIAMRVIYLEQENLQLRTEVSLLKADIDKLRCMLYGS